MKTINVSFEDGEMNAIRKAKGKQSWHDFILDSIQDFEKENKAKLSEVEEDMDTKAYNAAAKIQNARIEEIIGTKMFTQISAVIVNRSGKRYSLKAKRLKNESWINVEKLK